MPVQRDLRGAVTARMERNSSTDKGESDGASFFIPDLCSVQAVFVLVLVGELLALVLSVAGKGLRNFSWQDFATVSLFVQWTVLLCAAGLCQLRPRLSHWPRPHAAALSYVLVLSITAAVSVCAQILLGTLTNSGHWRIDGWALLDNLLISAVFAGIALRYFYLAQELRQRQRAELEARIQALQSRIRPHFLFNSMNSIASLIGSDAKAAEAAVEDLAALFRATLSQISTQVPLEDELDLCRRYLRIEQLRLGARLQIDWQMDALPEALLIPSLSLQPLLENAVYHGIQALPQGGCIRVYGECRDGEIAIEVCNPMPAAELSRRSSEQKGNRMALDNIARRLQALYGEGAGVSSEQRDGEYIARLHYRIERT
ncbi:MAG TPA: sensor histidine kinase [Spongiibacteraceae bacterium]|nr:sensor histidine kinase [Spongiibacteraceae bacterium]